MSMFLKIDHIGIATANLEQELERYFKDYGVQARVTETLEQQQVKLAFLDLPNSTVELLAPLGPNSTLQKFLENSGPGLHHIAYEVKNIKASLQKLAQSNYRLIDKEPRPGARESLVAFIHPASCNGVLTELVEYPSKNK